jgi:hypothetical protein
MKRPLQPNVKANVSTPASRNSTSNRRSPICFGIELTGTGAAHGGAVAVSVDVVTARSTRRLAVD